MALLWRPRADPPGRERAVRLLSTSLGMSVDPRWSRPAPPNPDGPAIRGLLAPPVGRSAGRRSRRCSRTCGDADAGARQPIGDRGTAVVVRAVPRREAGGGRRVVRIEAGITPSMIAALGDVTGHGTRGVLVGDDRNDAIPADQPDRRLDARRASSGSTGLRIEPDVSVPTLRRREIGGGARCPELDPPVAITGRPSFGRMRRPGADLDAGRTDSCRSRRRRCSCRACSLRHPVGELGQTPSSPRMIGAGVPELLRRAWPRTARGARSNASAPPVVIMSSVWTLSLRTIGNPVQGSADVRRGRARRHAGAPSRSRRD